MKDMKKTAVEKLGNALVNLGEKSARDCWFYGVYEPKMSVELLKSVNK